jgi:uncharacterized membrane protein
MPVSCRLLSLTPLALAVACGNDGSTSSVDTCVEQGLDYTTAAAPFLTTYCRSCHSAGSPERRGAPVGVDFDSEADAVAHASAIERTVLDEGSMPVGGGVPERDLERLRGWLACLP